MYFQLPLCFPPLPLPTPEWAQLGIFCDLWHGSDVLNPCGMSSAAAKAKGKADPPYHASLSFQPPQATQGVPQPASYIHLDRAKAA